MPPSPPKPQRRLSGAEVLSALPTPARRARVGEAEAAWGLEGCISFKGVAGMEGRSAYSREEDLVRSSSLLAVQRCLCVFFPDSCRIVKRCNVWRTRWS